MKKTWTFLEKLFFGEQISQQRFISHYMSAKITNEMMKTNKNDDKKKLNHYNSRINS